MKTAILVSLVWLTVLAAAQTPLSTQGSMLELEAPQAPGRPPAGNNVQGPPSAELQLYRQLRSVGLDPQRVYNIRDASLDREDIHVTFQDGTIGFTEDVNGRITGAFFEGHAEILLRPPDRAERESLALFTGAAILEERFLVAYLRFDDDTFQELKPWLLKEENSAEFIARWQGAARTLAESDALRLLASFTSANRAPNDRMLHLRVTGETLGTFDVFLDSQYAENVTIGQADMFEGRAYYNIWVSFPMRSRRQQSGQTAQGGMSGVPETTRDPTVAARAFKIRATVNPPSELQGDATVELDVRRSGLRVVMFELSRYLKLTSVDANGEAIGFIQNEAVDGSDLRRRGNDLVAVVFPKPLVAGQPLTLRFQYSGSVLADAGGGLLYVGARGFWYPNRGLSMASFDMEFRHPVEWTLVATGKRVDQQQQENQVISHWVSEQPVPLAGFNLGRYTQSVATAGNVEIATYAAGIETAALSLVRAPEVQTRITTPRGPIPGVATSIAPPPNPVAQGQPLANRAAADVQFFADRLGPFPFRSLSITQMPGAASQGWPGLIFLSSYVFLTPQERARARMDEFGQVIFGQVMQAHEIAHQWWGDTVLWASYRDQWLVEGLSNYCALLAVETRDPRAFQLALDRYRTDLLSERRGHELREAGPVTLGLRLSSSKFPGGYEAISYGRGTWLFHMLRHMLRDTGAPTAAGTSRRRASAADLESDAIFFRVLRKVIDERRGAHVSTAQLVTAFEQELPASLRFEGRRSLDWFIEHWINGTAIPRIELKDLKFVTQGAQTVVTGKLVQRDAPDSLITSVPLYASVGTKPVFVGRVFADGAETSFRVTAPAGVRRLLLDPYDTVLRRK